MDDTQGGVLQAGRELDALVAEKVMKNFIPAGSNPQLRDDAWIDGRGYFVWEPPPYSTHIADAWQVVEKMHELGWSVSISRHAFEGSWKCSMNKNSPDSFSAVGSSAAESMCLTALLAKLGADEYISITSTKEDVCNS